MDEDEERYRRWRRDIAFTGFQIAEIIWCSFIFSYYSTVYAPFLSNLKSNSIKVVFLRGYITSVFLLAANIVVRYKGIPKHKITPFEVVLNLWLWMLYTIMSIVVMNEVKPIQAISAAEYEKCVSITRKLFIFTIIAGKVFLLDAVLRADILIIKRPEIKKPLSSTGHRRVSTAITLAVPVPSAYGVSVVEDEPLNVDFFWFRFPECLQEEYQMIKPISMMTVTTDVSEGTIGKETPYIETSGETHGNINLMSRYAAARRKRRRMSVSNQQLRHVYANHDERSVISSDGASGTDSRNYRMHEQELADLLFVREIKLPQEQTFASLSTENSVVHLNPGQRITPRQSNSRQSSTSKPHGVQNNDIPAIVIENTESMRQNIPHSSNIDSNVTDSNLPEVTIGSVEQNRQSISHSSDAEYNETLSNLSPTKSNENSTTQLNTGKNIKSEQSNPSRSSSVMAHRIQNKDSLEIIIEIEESNEQYIANNNNTDSDRTNSNLTEGRTENEDPSRQIPHNSNKDGNETLSSLSPTKSNENSKTQLNMEQNRKSDQSNSSQSSSVMAHRIRNKDSLEIIVEIEEPNEQSIANSNSTDSDRTNSNLTEGRTENEDPTRQIPHNSNNGTPSNKQ